MILPNTSSLLIQVAKTRLKNPQTGKTFLCKYSDVPKDTNGWVTDLLYRPITGDMMILRIEDRVKTLSGWWDGRKWVGIRIKPEFKIVAWKRNLYDY
jgi:hypothetical protein